MSFRNYESLKLDSSNYSSVGWSFLLASLFYLFIFLWFFTPNGNKNKKGIEEKLVIENDNEIDQTEPFIEGRL